MTRHYWLSCYRLTVWVAVREGVIVEAAPIVWRFVGQSLDSLTGWMQGLGEFEMVELA